MHEHTTEPAPPRRPGHVDGPAGYVVVTVDPESGQAEAAGPMPGPDAAIRAALLEAELAAEGMGDVRVMVAALHPPEACDALVPTRLHRLVVDDAPAVTS